MTGERDDLHQNSVEVAAKVSGLRPDQVRAAIENYRASLSSIGDEPEWILECAVHGGIGHWWQYRTEGSEVIKYMTAKQTSYEYRRRAFATWQEARAIELQETARFKPRVASPSPHREG